MKRIICIGNRYILEDAAGPKVYERLRHCLLPHDIEVIDGGLAGLNLLRFVEGAEQVVFVDSVSGFGQPNPAGRDVSSQIVVLEAADVTAAVESKYDHAAGLAYLWQVLPQVCEGNVPHILLVGIEGYPDEKIVDEAATLALQIVVEGSRPRQFS